MQITNIAIRQITRLIATVTFLVYTPAVLAQDTFSKDEKPITQRLWQGITPDELKALKNIDVAVNSQNYEAALNMFNKINNPSNTLQKPRVFNVVGDVILWNKYSGRIEDGDVSFSDISRFVTDNSFYPNISKIKRNVENVTIKNNVSYQMGEQYFKTNPAGTTSSKLYLLKSKINFLQLFKGNEFERSLLKQEIGNLVSNIWINENFSDKQKELFLSEYYDHLVVEDYIGRANRLLWDGKLEQVKEIMPFVGKDYRRLFQAVIELKSFPRYIEKVVLSVPRRLRSSEILSYQRVLWYKSKSRVDDILDIMVRLPRKLENPEKWWSLRHLYAREMIKKKKYKIAYLLAAKNSLSPTSSDFWEAQWLSGWIALRFLDEPKQAYRHFDNLYRNVKQPVTIARAAYWLGMTSLAMGNKDEAIKWYKVAAQYPTFFYGQLAINKHRSLDSLNAKDDVILPKDPEITLQDMRVISESKAVRVAYLLAITGDKRNATKIFKYIVKNSATKGQIAVIMKVVNEIGDLHLDATISRTAAKRNVFFIRDKFQIIKEVSDNEYAPLVHAIIKQESGFAPTALSSAGAVGFMQLMPETAKLVAKDLGIRHSRKKLATDIQHNVRLGTRYIQTLIDRFDGSEILAIASYNAGPNNAQRWINEFYDPRQEEDIDMVVDWVELITYSETRNYVQRIMENLIVYKYLMSRNNYDAIK